MHCLWRLCSDHLRTGCGANCPVALAPWCCPFSAPVSIFSVSFLPLSILNYHNFGFLFLWPAFLSFLWKCNWMKQWTFGGIRVHMKEKFRLQLKGGAFHSFRAPRRKVANNSSTISVAPGSWLTLANKSVRNGRDSAVCLLAWCSACVLGLHLICSVFIGCELFNNELLISSVLSMVCVVGDIEMV